MADISKFFSQPGETDIKSVCTAHTCPVEPYEGEHYKTLTQSAIKTCAACPRLYYYRYIRQLIPITERPMALAFGQSFHKALELYYTKTHQDAFRFLQANYGLFGNDPPREWQMDAYRRSRAMLSGYIWKYIAGDPFEVMGVEVNFHGNLTNPTTGRISRTS